MNIPGIIFSIFAISICYVVSAIFARYFFPDEYVNLHTEIPIIDKIGENDISRDFTWTLCVVTGMAINVSFLHNFTSPLTYTLGCICLNMFYGSRDQNNILWTTKDKNNIILNGLPYVSAIGYTILSYLIYVASL